MEIELSGDEALVLFDFLARFRETDRLAFEHVAEFIALNKISGTLEESLVEPFDPRVQNIASSCSRAGCNRLESSR
jgi:hypothetical protein